MRGVEPVEIPSGRRVQVVRVSEAEAVNVSAGQAGGNGLPTIEVQAIVDASMQEHVLDTTPHPTYDEIPRLSLLFMNGLT